LVLLESFRLLRKMTAKFDSDSSAQAFL